MKVLFLGLGGVGQRHLRNLRQIRPDVRIGAVRHTGRTFEITPELRADAAINIEEKYAIACYPDLDTAVSDFGPDFAIIATPSNTHASLALALVRRGVPVFLEKPISDHEADLDELLRETEARGVAVMVGYMLRFHPGARRLKELFDARVLGAIQSAHIVADTYMPEWHPYEGVSDFYAGRSDLGGGTVLTNIHLVDLLHWMLGSPDRLWCRGGKRSAYDIDVEDTVTALFDYTDSAGSLPVSLNMSFVQKPVANEMTFRCASGTLGWDLGTGRVTVGTNGEGPRTDAFTDHAWNDMFVEELEHFIECLDNGSAPETALETVVGGHRMALAMKASLASGEIVRV